MRETEAGHTELFAPRLIPGVRIAPFDSAADVPTYLLTHPNGKRWEITELLRQVVLAIDGKSDIGEIGRSVCRMSDGQTSEEEVRRAVEFLIEVRAVDDPEESYDRVPARY